METHKIFLFGLDRAGKTCLANCLQNGQPRTDFKPTLALSVLDLEIGKIKFKLWDAPGQIRLRKLWLSSVEKSEILLFVLDVSEPARFQEAKDEFVKIVKDIRKLDIPLIFCFNKTDIANASDNIPKAKELFSLEYVLGRTVYPFETSIQKPESIDQVRNAIIKIFNEKNEKK